MTIMRQPDVTIPLGQGPDEATARLLRDGTQALSVIRNGDTTKVGGVRKARGLERLALTTTTHGVSMDAVYVSLAVHRDELVAVGLHHCYGIVANSAAVDGSAAVLRGPSMVGAYSIRLVHAASLGEDT